MLGSAAMFGRKPLAYVGKIAIVTGGASGIGRALAIELARRGASVVVCDRDGEGARAVADEVRREGDAWAEELDVRDLTAFESVVARTALRSGRVDLLFNNAGIGVGGEADGYAPADWDDVFDVNLRGVANGVQSVYRQMIAQRSGHIVNTASVLGLLPVPGNTSYTATKHAVVGLSRSLRVEAETHGVRVSVLCPGAVWTPILAGGRFGHSGYDGLREETIKKMWSALRPISPEALASKALDAVARDEAVIVVPGFWRAVWLADKLAPSAMLRIYALLLRRTRKDLAAAGATRAARRARRNGGHDGVDETGTSVRARRPMSN